MFGPIRLEFSDVAASVSSSPQSRPIRWLKSNERFGVVFVVVRTGENALKYSP